MCSSCGANLFQWKSNLAYHDAKYINSTKRPSSNALGSTNLRGSELLCTNPLDAWARAMAHLPPCVRTANLLMIRDLGLSEVQTAYLSICSVGSTITLENVAGTDVDGTTCRLSLEQQLRSYGRHNFQPADRINMRTLPEHTRRQRRQPIAVKRQAVKPAIEKGYAVITRAWKAGEQSRCGAPKVQRVHISEKIEDTRNGRSRYAARLQHRAGRSEISKALSPDFPLTTEWRGDSGVMVIKGKFADGSPMMAIPDYARTNRNKEVPLEGALPLGADGAVRPAQRPPTS